ncbi:unnamed protein product, partial [Didymodactylos carnosus]
FLIPKFLRNLRKKSTQHLLPPLLLTSSIATQPSTSNSSSSSGSLYPSRFYKKKNSLFHFPLTEPYILRTIVKYSFILLYFYLSDRTDFWMKENLHFTRVAFFLPLTYIGVLGIFFHDKLQQLSPLSSPFSSLSVSPTLTPTTNDPSSPFSSVESSTNHDNHETINDIEIRNDENMTTTTKFMISQQSSSSNTDDLFNCILNSEQIDEWKGWMQIVILAYQMTDASGKSIVLAMFVQLLISSYLFLAGYSHFVYYWKTGNYNFLNFLQMLFKYNFLTITLCLIMNRNYQSYYYPPLISFYFIMVYFTMAILPPRIHMSTIKDKSIYLVYLFLKLIVLGTLLTTLSLSEFLFEKLFTFKLWNNLFTTSTITSSLAAYAQQLHKSDLTHGGLNQLKTLLTHDVNKKLSDGEKSLLDYLANSGCGIVGPVTLSGITLDDITHNHHFHNGTTNNIYYDRNGTINDWYHRWNLDRYTILYGMCFAYLLIIIQNYDTYKTVGGLITMKKKQYQQQYRSIRFISLFCILGLMGSIVYTIILFLCSNKAICDEIHPYIIILPITCYIVLRNVPMFLRKHYSPFFSWFGRISLELFVTQYHIWLVANGHGTLTIIPRMPTLNLIVTTFIFICIAHELHIITNVLTPVFIPNDYKCFALVPSTAEQCASSLHFQFEEYVNASEDRLKMAEQCWSTYLSFIRYYASFSREWKYLFHVKNLHRGHVAKSFGLREQPDEMNNNERKERQDTFSSAKPLIPRTEKQQDQFDNDLSENLVNLAKSSVIDDSSTVASNSSFVNKNTSAATATPSINYKRPRYKNFSRVSEFSDGFDTMITKKQPPMKKRKDKLDEFLEKKRQRSMNKRTMGRKAAIKS